MCRAMRALQIIALPNIIVYSFLYNQILVSDFLYNMCFSLQVRKSIRFMVLEFISVVLVTKK